MTTLLATAARASSVTIGWDPNFEADLAGYRVSYGTAAGASDATVDVGIATTWTLADAIDGARYFFRVYAYNAAGMQSGPSIEVSTIVSGAPGPAAFSTNRSKLNFAVVRSGSTIVSSTPAQRVVVTQNGTTTVAWSVSTDAEWMRITPTSGTGTGTFTVQVEAGTLPQTGTYDTSIWVSSDAGSQTVPVRLRVYGAGTTRRAIGSFDTPVDGATNVVGAVPVTGWAIDDVEVAKVQIFRDPVGGEVGSVYVGDAGFVPGARPDIERDYADWPQNHRAGWGFMLLTNMLADMQTGAPFGGNGTFRLHAYATDAEGNVTYLGSKTITANNRDTSQPFGTIDTPGQGETISGTAYANFGWALSPRSSIPLDGSTMTVLIDGAAVGSPTYNNYRDDIGGIFPGYANSNGAVGYYILDTTQLANGQHTISWIVTDSLDNTAGLGSRYFTVLNASSAASAAVQSPALASTASSGLSARMIAELPVEHAAVEVARAAETDKTPEIIVPEWTGEVRVGAKEAEPIELRLANQFTDSGGTYEGYMIVGTDRRPLPLGSTLDAERGTFTWQPGAGFIGTYQLVFLRTGPAGWKTRIPVRIRIGPKFDREARIGGHHK